jgi:hypothetical protein
MAKRRMISTDLWEDEHFNRLADKEKILFIACISNADDEGRLSANPANLRAIAFRFEDISLNRIDELVENIAKQLKNFKVYSVNGCKYIQLEKWSDYQTLKTDRIKPSKFPECFQNVSKMEDKGFPNLSKVKLSKVNLSNTYSELEKALFDYWNEFIKKYPILSKIEKISQERRNHLKKRFESDHFRENIKIAIDLIKNSPFLRGENQRGWVITFDWLIANDTNYVKILEGRYKSKTFDREIKAADPHCQDCAGSGFMEAEGGGKRLCSCRLRK